MMGDRDTRDYRLNTAIPSQSWPVLPFLGSGVPAVIVAPPRWRLCWTPALERSAHTWSVRHALSVRAAIMTALRWPALLAALELASEQTHPGSGRWGLVRVSYRFSSLAVGGSVV